MGSGRIGANCALATSSVDLIASTVRCEAGVTNVVAGHCVIMARTVPRYAKILAVSARHTCFARHMESKSRLADCAAIIVATAMYAIFASNAWGDASANIIQSSCVVISATPSMMDIVLIASHTPFRMIPASSSSG